MSSECQHYTPKITKPITALHTTKPLVQKQNDNDPEIWRYTISGAEAPCKEVVKAVEFDISRYGDFSKIIRFDSPVDGKTAVEAAEEYLSEAASWRYYNRIKEDLACNDYKPEDFETDKILRGDLLTDCKFLESTILREDGTLVLFCGS